MKAKEMREKSTEELEARVEEIGKELYELKTRLSMEKKLDQPHLIPQKRRERARIMTVLTEKTAG